MITNQPQKSLCNDFTDFFYDAINLEIEPSWYLYSTDGSNLANKFSRKDARVISKVSAGVIIGLRIEQNKGETFECPSSRAVMTPDNLHDVDNAFAVGVALLEEQGSVNDELAQFIKNNSNVLETGKRLLGNIKQEGPKEDCLTQKELSLLKELGFELSQQPAQVPTPARPEEDALASLLPFLSEEELSHQFQLLTQFERQKDQENQTKNKEFIDTLPQEELDRQAELFERLGLN